VWVSQWPMWCTVPVCIFLRHLGFGYLPMSVVSLFVYVWMCCCVCMDVLLVIWDVLLGVIFDWLFVWSSWTLSEEFALYVGNGGHCTLQLCSWVTADLVC
jgi:hypothetical protein